jgi:dienelactone hydrolase
MSPTKYTARIYRLFSIAVALLWLAGCATFENHKGEKFPISLSLITNQTAAPSIIISHGGSCRLRQEDDWAQRFKAWGYNAIIIDHCTGRGIAPHTGVEPPPLPSRDRVNDYIAVAEWVKTQTWHSGKVAVFGISRGGEAVLRAADSKFRQVRRGDAGLAELDVLVALYPACSYVPRAPRIPLLILHGEADNLAVFSTCEYSGIKHDNLILKTYPDTYHGFEVPGPDITGSNRYLGTYISRRYNAESAAQSFVDTRAFLEKYLR